jgi:hypothetical protein
MLVTAHQRASKWRSLAPLWSPSAVRQLHAFVGTYSNLDFLVPIYTLVSFIMPTNVPSFSSSSSSPPHGREAGRRRRPTPLHGAEAGWPQAVLDASLFSPPSDAAIQIRASRPCFRRCELCLSSFSCSRGYVPTITEIHQDLRSSVILFFSLYAYGCLIFCNTDPWVLTSEAFMWWIWWIQIPLGFLGIEFFFSPPVSDRTSTWDCRSSCHLIGVSVHVKLLLSSCTYILLSKLVWIHTLVILYISIHTMVWFKYALVLSKSWHMYAYTPFSDYHIHIFFFSKIVWTHTLIILYISIRECMHIYSGRVV